MAVSQLAQHTALMQRPPPLTDEFERCQSLQALQLLDTPAEERFDFVPEQAPKPFDSFTQLDADANRRFAGAGLGLAICRHLVALMGRIEAEAQPGKGACFRFMLSLPLVHGAATQARASSLPVPLPAADGGPVGRVLLAEDSPSNQRVIQAMLQNTGYNMDDMANGREALQAVTERSYDLILMDVYRQDMDGLTAARKIRQDSRLPHLPIIALTANAMQGDEQRFMEAGMDAYLPKPVRKPDLLNCLH